MNHRIERKTLRVNAGAPTCELTTGSCCGDAIGPTTPATVVTRRKLWLPPGSQLLGDPFCVDVPAGDCCGDPSADGASGIRLTKQRVLVPAWALATVGCGLVEDCAEACVGPAFCNLVTRVTGVDTVFIQPEIPQFVRVTVEGVDCPSFREEHILPAVYDVESGRIVRYTKFLGAEWGWQINLCEIAATVGLDVGFRGNFIVGGAPTLGQTEWGCPSFTPAPECFHWESITPLYGWGEVLTANAFRNYYGTEMDAAGCTVTNPFFYRFRVTVTEL